MVANVSSGAFQVVRSIELLGTSESEIGNGTTSDRYTLTEAGTSIYFDGSTHNISSHGISGTSTGSYSYKSATSGSLSYQIDLSFSVDIPLNYYFDPTHVYTVFVWFSDISGLNNVASGNGATVTFSGIDARVAIGDKLAEMGETWNTSLGGDGFSADKVKIFIDASYICSVPPAGGTFDLGFSTSNVVVQVNDYGESNSNNVIDAIDKGTSSQDKGNQLQQEANETSKGIFDKISDFFGSFFENIINALKSLFVPDDGYFKDFFERLNDFFSDKLGMLYAPIELFIDVLTSIQNASSVSSGISFPEVKWNDTVLIESQTINLQMYADDFPELQEKLYFVTDVIMIGIVFAPISLPQLPDGIQTVLDELVGVMTSAVGLLGIFLDFSVVKWLIPVVIVIVNFDKVWSFIMFILRKIPFLGIE